VIGVGTGCGTNLSGYGRAVLQLFATNSSVSDLSTNAYFFCLGDSLGTPDNAIVCEAFSPFFNVIGLQETLGTEITTGAQDGRSTLANPSSGMLSPTIAAVTPSVLGGNQLSARLLPAEVQTLNAALTVTSSQPVPFLQTFSPTANSLTVTLFVTGDTPSATVTSGETSTTGPSVPPTATVVSVTSTPVSFNPSLNSGLSFGDKIGISIAVVAAILIVVLLGLLYLRRQRRGERESENVMLTQTMLNEARGPDLKVETDIGVDQSGLDLPLNSHGYHYHDISTPNIYTGGVPPAEMPRRHPTSATVPTAISAASDQYADVSTYGDARHGPRPYQGIGATLEPPFLNEPGMSREEVAILAEEERRIDAAIEEAERNNWR